MSDGPEASDRASEFNTIAGKLKEAAEGKASEPLTRRESVLLHGLVMAAYGRELTQGALPPKEQ